MRAVLLILILVALMGIQVAQRRGRKNLGIPSAVLAILALGISLTFALRPQQPTYLNRLEPFHRSVGYMLGQAVRDQLPNASQLIVLQDRREEATVVRFTTQQIEGLREGLGPDACEVVYVNIRDIANESTAPPEEGIEREAVLSAYEKFKAVTEENPDARAIVSFVGYPGYVRLLLRRDARYRLFVWDVGTNESVNWETELAQGRVSARVGYRPHPNMQSDLPSSTSMEEIFAMRYELITGP